MKNEVIREAPGCCYASCFRFLSQSVQRIDKQENDPAVIKVKQHSRKGPLDNYQIVFGLPRIGQISAEL
jgi:hypothetical protein